ncbi:MAG: hypothetical protein ABEH78_07685 [Haloferacaceae archaeon]
MADSLTDELLASGAARVGLFFAASLLVATVLGAALGDVRQGVTTGISVGFLTAAFALLFVRPAESDGDGERDAGPDGDGDGD